MSGSAPARKESWQLLTTQSPAACLRSAGPHFYRVQELFIRRAFLSQSGKEKRISFAQRSYPSQPLRRLDNRWSSPPWLHTPAEAAGAGIPLKSPRGRGQPQDPPGAARHFSLPVGGQQGRGSRDRSQLEKKWKRKIGCVWAFATFVQCGGGNPSTVPWSSQSTSDFCPF